MTIPSTIESLSTTIGSNVPAEGDGTAMTSTNDGLRAAYGFIRQTVSSGSDIASASTITPPSNGSSFNITGTTTITAIGSTYSWNGRMICLRFEGSIQLTHSSSLVLPASANISAVSGDYAVFRQYSSGVWHCVSYLQATPFPVGAIIHVAQTSAPSGFLKANGAAVSRTTYSALFAAIGTTFGSGDGSTTFNVPDLRGEFIRGYDDSRGVDTSRVFGSAQSDELKSHTHGVGTTDTLGGGGSAERPGAGTAQLSTATGGTETRPRNIALLACIKY